MRNRVYSGAPWEKQVAYCRAIRVGNIVTVSGTTAIDEHGNVVGVNDIYNQTLYIFKKIDRALNELGASISDVTRTRMFVTDIEMFSGVGKAHSEVFSGIDPAATCVEISRLVRDDLLIEIEVDGIVENRESAPHQK
jgi:enamine deaminase RidA (YjgF/YER057c/UK114 family)